MANVSVFGAQWGDEGKGKVVDYLTEHADVVVRFAGGANAGHTLVVDDQTITVHLLPSGAARPNKICILGDGMVIDPAALIDEIASLRAVGISLDDRLWIGRRAHLVLPYHRLLDELRERRPGALGTTKRGIGPAYEDKVARRGLRAVDLLRPGRARSLVSAVLDNLGPQIAQLGGEPPGVDQVLDPLLEQGAQLEQHLADTSMMLWQANDEGRRLLFEGAQGALLDIDHGTYPFVTSSTTYPAGACAGAGVSPRMLGIFVGVAKAYVTRVGEGPMPSEDLGDAGQRLRDKGAEFGVTTGRPRRCGWLDAVALRHMVRIAGVDWIALTKLDVLGEMGRVPICTAYRLGSSTLDVFPSDPDVLKRAEPSLRELPGFPRLTGDERNFGDLPSGARHFVESLEQVIGVKIGLISVGPGRDATISRERFD